MTLTLGDSCDAETLSALFGRFTGFVVNVNEHDFVLVEVAPEGRLGLSLQPYDEELGRHGPVLFVEADAVETLHIY